MRRGELHIRSYDAQTDRERVEDLQQRCEVGSADSIFLVSDTLGDPICRIRNSPIFIMLVALVEGELVGVIQGSVKLVTLPKPPTDQAKVGYVLGLRVEPLHRRQGIGSSLVLNLEQWFASHDVEYAYMATEKDNNASVSLFVTKLNYVAFRTPTILVNPVSHRLCRISYEINIRKVQTEEAESLYRKFMSSADFFPDDINSVLRNKLSLGTWVAHRRDETWDFSGSGDGAPTSWAMLSVWNSGEVFKLRQGNTSLCCLACTKGSSLLNTLFPCLNLPVIPDFMDSFGFYFIYGIHGKGPAAGRLIRMLCKYVHNIAKENADVKVLVTEVGESDSVASHIPHWNLLLTCPEDLWCIKALKNSDVNIHELTKTPPTRPLFVDPREV